MITFDLARDQAQEVAARTWDGRTMGSLWAAPWGYEDAEHWQVVVGAREWLELGDEDYVLMDAPVYLVAKANGSVTVVDRLGKYEKKLDAMKPYPGDK
jgi:hypothetical protein